MMKLTSLLILLGYVRADYVYYSIEHDNEVVFKDTTIDFDLDGYDISHDQPFGSVSESGDTMTIQAGRHADASPAATFIQGLQLFNTFGLNTLINQTPYELNFVVYGTMDFTFPDGSTYECPDFRIAQGNHLGNNNWWIGSSDCGHIPETNTMVCCCGNYQCSSSIVPAPFTENYAV
jgi:hypothetical protein